MASALKIAALASVVAASFGAHAETAGVAADCSSVGGNLIANCGFESGAPPPSPPNSFGTLSIDSSSPHSGSFSLRAISQLFPGTNKPTVYANTNCMSLVPDRRYVFGGWTRTFATTTTVGCGVFIVSFTAPACGGQFTTAASSGVSLDAPSGWQSYNGVVSSPSWLSGYVQLFCNGGDVTDTFTAGFDDTYFFAEIDPILADGFE